MSTMGELAGHLVEFGGDLHTHGGWLARMADGRAVDGYRYARLEGCRRDDCPGIGACDGCVWQYVGRAFAEADAVAILVEILEAEEHAGRVAEIMPARRAGDVLVGRVVWDGATGEWTITHGTRSATTGGPAGGIAGLESSLRRHGFTTDGWQASAGRVTADVYTLDWSVAP